MRSHWSSVRSDVEKSATSTSIRLAGPTLAAPKAWAAHCSAPLVSGTRLRHAFGERMTDSDISLTGCWERADTNTMCRLRTKQATCRFAGLPYRRNPAHRHDLQLLLRRPRPPNPKGRWFGDHALCLPRRPAPARFVFGSRSSTPDLMVLADGSTFRIVSDQLGSPRVVVSASGATAGTIVQRIDYDEFGNRTITSNTGAFATRAQPYGFAGGLYDEDTGLVHFGAREYDPSVGRWVSKDPILFGGKQGNLYVYAGNDPVNLSDPRGTDVCQMSTDEGYHHEWIDIDGRSYGFWPGGISGSAFLDASQVYSPDPHENDRSRSAVCTASTPDESRELENWIEKNYQPNRTNRATPYSFGSQDCRGFQDSVMDKLADIQGTPAPWHFRIVLLPHWWAPYVLSLF